MHQRAGVEGVLGTLFYARKSCPVRYWYSNPGTRTCDPPELRTPSGGNTNNIRPPHAGGPSS